MSLCSGESASTSLVSAESTELLQARLDICDLRERVNYLERTLQTVLEQQQALYQLIQPPQSFSYPIVPPLGHQPPQPFSHQPPQGPSNQPPQLFSHQPPQPFSHQPPQRPSNQPSQSFSHQSQAFSHQFQPEGDGTCSRPLPLRPKKTIKNALPSSAIKKEKLVSASIILGKYSNLQVESKVSNLAQRLARLSFFGEDVMVQCTPNGVEICQHCRGRNCTS